MAKKFNITGNCIAEQHYMADVSKKLEKVYGMVESGDYFIINRPRQYGKTTTLFSIADKYIKTNDYAVFSISFEGIGDKVFETESDFCSTFVKILARHAHFSIPEIKPWLKEVAPSIIDLDELADMITELADKTSKKLILIIDEVDKSSNNQLFVSFLAMLRNKYLERQSFKTFHSIVLAGVYDVKSLKLKLRPDDEQKYNSPWNIAAEFKVDMNLQVEEITPMLEEYAADKNVSMDTRKIAEKLFYFTSGYPFLVSKLCKMLDEEIVENGEWTVTDVEYTVQQLLKQDNTNFESLIKNLENYPDLYQITEQILMNSSYFEADFVNPTVKLGILHGILKNGDGVHIHNIIYKELIYRYMSSKVRTALALDIDIIKSVYELPDRVLDLERVLLEFQLFMKEQYSKKDRDFLEKNGRLVFLAFLRPILAGAGYDFKEVQISEERRLDVTITYYNRKFIVEMKIWRGEKAHEKGIKQLVDYLEKNNQEHGFLLVFDHSEVKDWRTEWIEAEGKKIFVAWV